jgi:hypothetical protein
MAGFIFGGDEDTPATAGTIASFAESTAIPTAMTGMLTPIPHTPLAERLRVEGRLMESEFSGNNTDDEVQFVPRRMSVDEMRDGYYQILEALFAPGAMYRRSALLLERLRPHIFRGRNLKKSDVRAALRSLWRQGVVRRSRGDYARLLMRAAKLDLARRREATRALEEVNAIGPGNLSPLVARARDAIVRAQPSKSLAEVREWTSGVAERIEQGRPTADDVRELRHWASEYWVRQRAVHRFPGAYVVKAFDLAIKGLHYETVMTGIVRRGHGAAG